MISYRAYEIKKNRSIISLEFRNKVDGIVIKLLSRSIIFFNRLYIRIKLFFANLTHSFYEKLHFAWRKLSGKVDRYLLKLKGRRNIGKKGSVSIYWQQVTKKTEDDN